MSASRVARGLSGLWLPFYEASKNPTPLHFIRVCIDYISFLPLLKILQTFVSSILRPLPTEVNAPLFPTTSHVCVQIEQTRLELLTWIRKRSSVVICQEKGFDPLEKWASKENIDRKVQFSL